VREVVDMIVVCDLRASCGRKRRLLAEPGDWLKYQQPQRWVADGSVRPNILSAALSEQTAQIAEDKHAM
jgi:hypothetical protein